jgi:transitional endoplasmic reticulum ATPase
LTLCLLCSLGQAQFTRIVWVGPLKRRFLLWISPFLFSSADALRQLYPKHSLVMSDDPRSMGILSFPGVAAFPVDESQLVTNLVFIPLARRLGIVRGVLLDSIEFGSFQLAFGVITWLIYHLRTPTDFPYQNQEFILHVAHVRASRLAFLRYWVFTLDDFQ